MILTAVADNGENLYAIGHGRIDPALHKEAFLATEQGCGPVLNMQ